MPSISEHELLNNSADFYFDAAALPAKESCWLGTLSALAMKWGYGGVESFIWKRISSRFSNQGRNLHMPPNKKIHVPAGLFLFVTSAYLQ